MSPTHKRTSLVVGFLTLLAALPARAHDNPFEGFDFQLFAPYDVRSDGSQPDPKTGPFFSFEGLIWSIQQPRTAWIGEAPPFERTVYPKYTINTTTTPPTITIFNTPFPEVSTTNTSPFEAQYVMGDRFQFGYMDAENGWLAEIYALQPQTNTFTTTYARMAVDDRIDKTRPDSPWQSYSQADAANHWLTFASNTLPTTYSPVPGVLAQMTVTNTVEHWNTELMYVRRFTDIPYGGELELLLGARYMEFNDQFAISSRNSLELAGLTGGTIPWSEGGFADTVIVANAKNHIIGPQIGGRWSRYWGRWQLTAEGRFCAGLNQQNIHLYGVYGNQNASFANAQEVTNGPQTTTADAYMSEFTPVVEARIDLNYQITRHIAARVGWDGIWMDHIARASGIIDYTYPQLTIDRNLNWQDVLITGVNIGVVVNR